MLAAYGTRKKMYACASANVCKIDKPNSLIAIINIVIKRVSTLYIY